MKMRSGLACLMTAVAAVSVGSNAQAADLFWDSNGSADPVAADGSGNWNFSEANWYNPAAVSPAPSYTPWIDGNNAIFGDPANTAPIVGAAPVANVSILDNVVANDIHINTTSAGGFYTFDAPNFNSLTINGNVYKNSAAGQIKFDLLNGPFILGAGDRVFALRDTSGDVPEMTINANISGAGGLTVDNRLTLVGPKEAWGTLSTTGINTYAGTTNIKFGRLVISQNAGLGGTSAGTVISEAGTLSIGGPGVSVPTDLTISEPITIQRNTYTGGEFGRYGTAVATTNGTGTTTFDGPFIVDSNDARIAANTSTLVVASNISVGPNATTPMLSVGGDFAGFVRLTGNNTALTGGVNIVGAQLDVNNDNQIGGPTAPLQLNGGVYHPVNGYATDFGAHPINAATFNGSINVDAGQVFNINQPLGQTTLAVGSLSKRGTGTMNITSDVNLRGGQSYWDGGIVNVGVPITLANLHLRSPIVNVGTGASITTTGGFSAFGEASTGTNGGPDIAVLNLTGNGKFIQNQNEDLNISDQANTRGTVNISDNAEFITAGLVHVGRNNNAIGTINQTGGVLKVNRTGNFGFIVSRGQGQGVYNLSGGTFDSLGEVYVGQGGGNATSGGQWNQTGGIATISNWFVMGRESGKGDVDISGGTLIKKGGGNVPIGEGTNARGNSFTVRGTGVADFQTGEVWVSNGNTTTTMTLADQGVINGNNFFVIGRFGNSKGILNMSGGTLNKLTTNPFIVAAGGGSNGIVNQTGGVFNNPVTRTLVGDGGTGTWNLSGGSINANLFQLGASGTEPAVVNMSGGSLKAVDLNSGGGTGTKTFNFTGGTLSVGTFNVGAGLNNSGTGRVAPGGVGTVGSTAVATSYTQGTTASYAADIGGAASADNVAVTGDVNLAGNIALTLLNGFVPAYNVPQTLMSFTGTRTGNFGTVEGLIVANNKRLAVSYTGTTVEVEGALPGDATLDGVVEFADLVALAQNYNGTNRTWETGDFDGDGLVAFADLVTLAQFYNQTTGGQPTAVSEAMASATFQTDWALAQTMVPEPGSLAVLGLGAVAALRRRRI